MRPPPNQQGWNSPPQQSNSSGLQQSWNNTLPTLYPPLSVSEIERLAKAGVTMTFSEIEQRVMSDPVKDDPHQGPHTLNEALWMRWRMAHADRDIGFLSATLAPYTTACVKHEGIVYVFVAPNDAPPFIIEDNAAIFPSDALMGSLALYEKVKP